MKNVKFALIATSFLASALAVNYGALSLGGQRGLLEAIVLVCE